MLTRAALNNPLRRGTSVKGDDLMVDSGRSDTIKDDASDAGAQKVRRHFGDGVGRGVRLHDDSGACVPLTRDFRVPAAGDPTKEMPGGIDRIPNIPRIGGGSGYRLPPDAKLVQGRFPRTSGPHQLLYRADPATGVITSYAVYDANGLPVKRVDLVGPEHGGVPTPHVHVFNRNVAPDGTVFINTDSFRPAHPEEVP